MLALALSSMLAASPTIAVGAVESAGYDAGVVSAWMERFTQLLAGGGRVHVVNQADLAQLLGLERQRALLGCEASSCMSELAAALGADGLLRASIARSGKSTTLSLKLLRTRDGAVWLSATERVTSEDAAQEWLDATARAFADQLAPPPTPARSPVVRWLPALGGVALAGGATACLLISGDKRTQLASATALDAAAIDTLKREGQSLEVAGLVLSGVAGAAVLTSVIWVVAAPDAAATVSLAPMPGGASLWVGGRF